MSWFFKSREIQLGILIVSFFFGFIPYFFVSPALDAFADVLSRIAAVVGSFTIAVAIYSQYKRSLRFIRERRKGWPYHIYLIVLMLGMLVIGVTLGEHHPAYMWLVNAIVTPLSSVIYGILAFYMASAGARAFRARSLKAAFLLIAGFIVLLYQAPLTGAFIPQISPVATYLGDSFGMSLSRIFSISVVIGGIILNVRMLTGRELAFLGFAREES